MFTICKVLLIYANKYLNMKLLMLSASRKIHLRPLKCINRSVPFWLVCLASFMAEAF